MDAMINTITEKFSSKRAALSAFVIYILKGMAEADPTKAVYYAGGMVVIALGFMVSEHIEKGRKSE